MATDEKDYSLSSIRNMPTISEHLFLGTFEHLLQLFQFCDYMDFLTVQHSWHIFLFDWLAMLIQVALRFVVGCYWSLFEVSMLLKELKCSAVSLG